MRTIVIGLLALLIVMTMRADDAVKIHGFIDAYYAWNSSHPASHENFEAGTGSTARRANEFDLNLAEVDITRDAKTVGFHLSLIAGNGADVIHASEPQGYRFVYQASILYKRSDRLTFEAGIYPSHIGFEGFFSKDNWSYTRGWLAEFSPYYQTGISANYAFSSHWSGELHVLNGWQNIADNNDAKAIGGKIAYAKGRLTASLNTFDGPELADDDKQWRHFGDLIATFTATPRLSIGGSIDRGRQEAANWVGVAAYGRYAFDERRAVAVRAERFSDPQNGISGTPQKLAEATLTFEYRPAPNLILKVEGRRDHSTAPAFNGSSSRDETIVVIGAVATF
ncbi:MAG: porin [Thermoanaerobaculia bacterium]